MNGSDAGSAIGSGLAVGTMITAMIGFFIASIIIFGYPLYVIAQKQGHPSPWWAFVPILQAVLIFQMGDQNPWLLLLALIPCVNLVAIVFLVMAWMKIAEKQGFPGWMGILIIVPIANIIMPFYVAMASPPQQIGRM